MFLEGNFGTQENIIKKLGLEKIINLEFLLLKTCLTFYQIWGLSISHLFPDDPSFLNLPPSPKILLAFPSGLAWQTDVVIKDYHLCCCSDSLSLPGRAILRAQKWIQPFAAACQILGIFLPYLSFMSQINEHVLFPTPQDFRGNFLSQHPVTLESGRPCWSLEEQHLELSFLLEAVGTALDILPPGPWKRAASALAARLHCFTERAWLVAFSSCCHLHGVKQGGCWHASPLLAKQINRALLIAQGFTFSADITRGIMHTKTYFQTSFQTTSLSFWQVLITIW